MAPTETRTADTRQEDAAVSPPWRKIAEKLALDSPKAHHIAFIISGVLTVELAIAIAAAHFPTLNAMMSDVCTLLDGGYRVALGQRPHVDFYSPLGALCLLLLAGGIKAAGFASAFSSVHAVMLIVLVPWTWALLRSRTSAVLAGTVSLWNGVLAVTPRSLGFSPPTVAYAMQYNRWAWALLSIACIELLLPRRDGRVRMLAGASTGIIAGLLLFIKINYLAAVLAAILVRIVVSRFNRRWAAGLAGGFLAVAVAGFWYLRFDFGAYLRDIRLIGSVATLSGQIASVVQLSAANIPDLCFLGGALLIAVPIARWAGVSLPATIRMAAPTVALAAIGILTCSANYQALQIPTIYLAIFLLVERVRRISKDCEGYGSLAFLAIFLIGAGAVAKPFFDDIATLTAVQAQPRDPQTPAWLRFEAPAIAGLRVEPPPEFVPAHVALDALRAGVNSGGAYPYVPWFNSGAALLRDRLPAHPRVLVLDFSNPFSFALGLTPPRGDGLVWHYSRTFDLKHHPDSSRVFGTVTDVMIPKTPMQWMATKRLQQIYAPVLARDFEKAAENDLWIRYERRK